jgi:hypothetical protein
VDDCRFSLLLQPRIVIFMGFGLLAAISGWFWRGAVGGSANWNQRSHNIDRLQTGVRLRRAVTCLTGGAAAGTGRPGELSFEYPVYDTAPGTC